MKRKGSRSSNSFPAGERGQILVVVMVFMVLGSLVLGPLLAYLGTAFHSGGVYRDKTDRFYAADSGIEDAIWQIKYDHLYAQFALPEYNPPYDAYDFTTAWTYDLDEPVNEQAVTVTIRNVWLPTVTPADLGITWQDARAGVESNKLIVTGTATGGTYKIKITFNPEEGEEEALLVESIGIWLPLGFTYDGDCNILSYEPLQEYSPAVTVAEHDGGQAVVWEFGSPAPFTAFPGVDPEAFPLTTEVSFSYTSSQPDVQPAAVAWMTTLGVPGIRLSWDADTKIYRIDASAGGTEIETYAVKCELRKMGAAIGGDYRAIGNSLMIDKYSDPWEIRDYPLDESSTAVSDIPADAEVVAAYLYWSGWFANEAWEAIWEDDCDDFTYWTHGGSWSDGGEYFQGHDDDDGPDLTLDESIDLSGYSWGDVQVSWYQWEHGDLEGQHSYDALNYQFYGNGSWSEEFEAFRGDIGSTPRYEYATVPSDYLADDFKFRFRLHNFNSGDEYCYIDDFCIATVVREADTDAIFKINGVQVFLNEEGEPETGSDKIEAAAWETLGNQPGEYSYACHQDVTKLVQTYSNLGDNENHTGNGLYTVGDVEADPWAHWSYAGWSLIIIYTSPVTAGHQLFLYDNFAWAKEDQNLDFDNDGEPGGSISGFIMPDQIPGEVNAATLTCFVAEGDNWLNGDQLVFEGTPLSDGFGTGDVWNSQSIGMSEDGMDIDTFTVTWGSGLLEPGDTTAQLDLPTGTDNWNLIYIILSFRSRTTTGGTSHYVVRGG